MTAGMIEMRLFIGEESQGIIKFMGWPSFAKWVADKGTVIMESGARPGDLLIVKTLG